MQQDPSIIFTISPVDCRADDLWFDPTADFHTYSIEWTQQHIL